MRQTPEATAIFKDSLFDKQDFTLTFELVPGRGSGGKRLERILDFAGAARTDGRIKALSITDNPGGHPALSPTPLGLEIHEIGIEPLIHFSLKDKNRNMAESQLFECHRHGLQSLLVLGGDYPRYGFQGQAMPVFDLDSVQLLDLISHLRHSGSLEKEAPGGRMELQPMDFLAGCVVSPFKTREDEQVFQYRKLLSKVQSGANFIISQLGFDMDKYRELIRFCQNSQLNQPLMANIFIPSLPVAMIMNRGQVPGVLFPDRLLQIMEQEATTRDRGDEARLLRAAKMIAIIKGMGYDGVHVGGNNLNFDKISFVLDQAESFGTNWRDLEQEVHFPAEKTWYFYGSQSPRGTTTRPSRYLLNKLIHDSVFEQDGPLFSANERLARWSSKTPTRYRIYTLIEACIKKILFRCRMCGDCTLAESGYLCPQSGCPKRMINGPCGGSLDGWCEVYPKERLCFWVRVYKQEARGRHTQKISPCPHLPPKDWNLHTRSSWINYFTGRDHHKLNDKDNP
ncbi:MAG: methylenetetrahydrofolate reductase C-terminal domain-containing protein [Desulfobulbaceae bacterium]|uniref:Methylenetetrahydrofolate reductase n=1 Tax=Candidatus Desulfatifera sulfidica TaxID=2841691 RepID=A0A8J6N9N6_9BACT|nr:methylenetetrahydrofolate reductase C-terminal domain-containing protein [Candidatus Desulfatifera sulfidica]